MIWNDCNFTIDYQPNNQLCVCVRGERSSYCETITSSITFFIYLEINTIRVINNFIHQAKLSSACFRTMMRSDNNENDLNDME